MRRGALGAIVALGLMMGVLLAAPALAATTPSSRSTAPSATTQPARPGEGWLTGRRQRLLAVWILVDVGGALLWFGSAPARAPKLLGSVGAHRSSLPTEGAPDQEVRGIGRFARPRTAPPSRLL